MKIIKKFLFIIAFLSISVAAEDIQPITVETLFGPLEITDPLIIELIHSPAMQRAKEIDQSGASRYYREEIPPFSRYYHSLGVYYLLARFNLPREEQVAGLLHDASHTVFSHTGEFLFNHFSHEDSYQDSIHAWSLEKQGIGDTLTKYNLKLDDIVYKDKSFPGLEQHLPDICADRIEYNLNTGVLLGLITNQDVLDILNDLHFDGENWYFGNPLMAKKLALLPLYFTEHFWGANWNWVLSHYFSESLRRAVELDLISYHDIHFSTDAEILAILENSHDEVIQDYLKLCEEHNDIFSFTTTEIDNYDYFNTPKFRGFDPLIKINGSFKRLRELDEDFAAKYERTKEESLRGFYITIKRQLFLIYHQLEKK